MTEIKIEKAKLIKVDNVGKRYIVIYCYANSTNYWNVGYQLFTTPEDARSSIENYENVTHYGIIEIELPLMTKAENLQDKISNSALSA